MLDHIGLAVRDFGRSVTFYRRALAPLGVQTVLEMKAGRCSARDGRPQFDGHNIEAVCHAPE